MHEGGFFHNRLKELINEYILLGYAISKKFPKEERYGMITQCTRALLSIMLNYVEGYARTKKKVMLNFYEIAYGSLQESAYIFYLAFRLHYIDQKQYMDMFVKKEEIAKMLWSTIQGLRKEND